MTICRLVSISRAISASNSAGLSGKGSRPWGCSLAATAGCAVCRDTLASYRRIRAAYRDVPDADVDPAVARRIVEAARARHARPARPRRRWLVAAACLVIAALGVRFFAPSPAEGVEHLITEAEHARANGDLAGAESAY